MTGVDLSSRQQQRATESLYKERMTLQWSTLEVCMEYLELDPVPVQGIRYIRRAGSPTEFAKKQRLEENGVSSILAGIPFEVFSTTKQPEEIPTTKRRRTGRNVEVLPEEEVALREKGPEDLAGARSIVPVGAVDGEVIILGGILNMTIVGDSLQGLSLMCQPSQEVTVKVGSVLWWDRSGKISRRHKEPPCITFSMTTESFVMLTCDNAAEAPAMAMPLCDAVSWAQEKHGASFEKAVLDHDVTPGEGDAWRINSKGAYSYTLGEAEASQGARMLMSLLDHRASCSVELAWGLRSDEKEKALHLRGIG